MNGFTGTRIERSPVRSILIGIGAAVIVAFVIALAVFG